MANRTGCHDRNLLASKQRWRTQSRSTGRARRVLLSPKLTVDRVQFSGFRAARLRDSVPNEHPLLIAIKPISSESGSTMPLGSPNRDRLPSLCDSGFYWLSIPRSKSGTSTCHRSTIQAFRVRTDISWRCQFVPSDDESEAFWGKSFAASKYEPMPNTTVNCLGSKVRTLDGEPSKLLHSFQIQRSYRIENGTKSRYRQHRTHCLLKSHNALKPLLGIFGGAHFDHIREIGR